MDFLDLLHEIGKLAKPMHRDTLNKILSLDTPFKETARQLSLSWGVYPELPKAGSYGYLVNEEEMFDYDSPVLEEASDDFNMVLRNACRAALRKGLVSSPDDLLVVTAGLPFGTPGAANVIRIVPAAGPTCWDGVCRVD